MSKFTVLGQFEAERLPAVVPPDYRSVVRAVTTPGFEYTVVLFAHDRRDVIPSAPVRRALGEVTAGDRLLAVGANFTAEATELLNARSAAIARLGAFYWTDESYNSLR